MSPAQAAAAAYHNATHGLHSRWMRCHRNIKRLIGFISATSAVVGLCSTLWAQGLLPATQYSVRKEVERQVGPMVLKIEGLHADVANLQGDLVKYATAPANADLISLLARIEAKVDGLNKPKAITPK